MIAATNIERRHLTEQRRNIYIACEDLNFFWDEDQVSEVIAMWNMGIPVEYIASNFGREVDEVAILIFDLCRQGKIEPRPGGVFGRGVVA
ncbi:helix-turn-helix domain-containing protein [Aneurinibacillus thermoaerophilus]|uniref:helix-turn-helix domain-containing protein n=1 Tax=Aneurinibacillus thermoaerophilus TaxID=143495 RepID=UPI002E21EF76|nr:helix-turn-helix domain-containing protein [Aneurinibacillus thermoaerophilus]